MKIYLAGDFHEKGTENKLFNVYGSLRRLVSYFYLKEKDSISNHDLFKLAQEVNDNESE